MIRVIHQRFEHRRRQSLEIKLCRADDGSRHKLGRILEQAHECIRMLQHVCRDHFRRKFVAEQEDRQPLIAAAFGRQHLLQHRPSRGGILRPVHGDQPA